MLLSTAVVVRAFGLHLTVVNNFFIDLLTANQTKSKRLSPNGKTVGTVLFPSRFSLSATIQGLCFLLHQKTAQPLATQHIVLATIRGSEMTLDYGIHRTSFEIEAGELYALNFWERVFSRRIAIITYVNRKKINSQNVSPPYSVLDDVEVHYGSPDFPPADVEVNRFYYFELPYP